MLKTYKRIDTFKHSSTRCLSSLPAIFESYATPTPHIPLSLARNKKKEFL